MRKPAGLRTLEVYIGIQWLTRWEEANSQNILYSVYISNLYSKHKSAFTVSAREYFECEKWRIPHSLREFKQQGFFFFFQTLSLFWGSGGEKSEKRKQSCSSRNRTHPNNCFSHSRPPRTCLTPTFPREHSRSCTFLFSRMKCHPEPIPAASATADCVHAADYGHLGAYPFHLTKLCL